MSQVADKYLTCPQITDELMSPDELRDLMGCYVRGPRGRFEFWGGQVGRDVYLFGRIALESLNPQK
jgi:hypothetical protein